MTFSEYYEHYLTLHTNKWCRRLHVLGQLFTIAFVVLVINYSLYPLLILGPFIVYPFAWSGHFYFEKNKPAAFSRPIWAKACDWIMLKDILIGRIKW
tara:strand:- start:1448 stop:1738 length:291 start_codon:yes stop_codon:yes gene_type:complete